MKAAKTLKVRFLDDAVLRDATGAVAESYRAGSVHDLRSDKASRWIRRGTAEMFGAAPEPETPREAVNAAVDIPANWMAMHWKAQAALTTRLVGRDVTKAAEARQIIEAEAKRREPPSDAGDAGFAAAQEAARVKALEDDGA